MYQKIVFKKSYLSIQREEKQIKGTQKISEIKKMYKCQSRGKIEYI